MSTHPVQLQIQPTARMGRVHVVIRLALLLALGAIGCSSVYWLLYLLLPAAAALLISQKGSEDYMKKDVPAIMRVLTPLAGAYAYLWLLTDLFPTAEVSPAVELAIEPSGSPSATSALLRLVYSLPALLVLVLLSIAAGFLWVIAALIILVRERSSNALSEFFTAVLRYQFRLVAYHLSLVDHYPSFEVTGVPHVSGSGVA